MFSSPQASQLFSETRGTMAKKKSGILVDPPYSSDLASGSDNEVVFDSCAYQIPHPRKRHKGGEDTLFISATGRVVGVFDGVGAWGELGVDPRKYALKLSQGAQEATDELHLLRPIDVLKYAYKYSADVMGSSLACIATISGNVLEYANLGDSGILVVRPPSMLLHRSLILQHSFNLPYQLGPKSGDLPEDAIVCNIDVEMGDIVILGTDGLFDNLEHEVIVDIISQQFKSDPNIHLDKLAMKISQEAFARSQDRKGQTPFSRNALKHGYHFPGGKPDDITLILSRITSLKDAREQKSIRQESAAVEAAERVQASQFSFHKLRSLFYWKTLLKF
ncbi:uncharacterized protein LOC126318217 isoform X2 [Schistocerca gregaria]|nr:uncharacterized protein LOC126318217 isoform X2 [Schistocerca gregaria]